MLQALKININYICYICSIAGSGRGWESLQEAYGLLRHVAKTKPTSDAPEAFSQDLYILCAETAFQVCTVTE